jgi:hypothetical protein
MLLILFGSGAAPPAGTPMYGLLLALAVGYGGAVEPEPEAVVCRSDPLLVRRFGRMTWMTSGVDNPALGG